MLKILTAFAFGAALALLASAPGSAAPVQPGLSLPSSVIPVSGGCGPNGWRGPYGHCRYGGGGGYYRPRPYYGNGCPRGYWRGPWGHCRNTPYHGRLPNGGWK